MHINLNDEKKVISFPPEAKFKYEWRKYQKRVLNELEEHINDNHLHIIAPPGSGKTVLGLEVILKLNKPTLILAPTIAIRNQWINRFCDLFLQIENRPEWISTDIKNPCFLTVATYQSLHAACCGNRQKEQEYFDEEINENSDYKKPKTIKTKEIASLLQSKNIGTIVVDEAHHLKNAWWQSLNEIKKALNPTIVGLTATPPYDVSYAEWQRYIELNGPVDAEISVPELVVEGDLCPHQDYTYISRPTDDEHQKIVNFRQRLYSLFAQLKADKTIFAALKNHPIYNEPKKNLNWIYSNIECYSSVLIFLNSAGEKIDKNHLDIIGSKNFNLPELNYEWIETLLSFYLFKNPGGFSEYEEHQKKLVNQLKRHGVLERKSINFKHCKTINKFLSSSLSKLKGVEKIVDFEFSQLKSNLRMVILTDYIRKEFLVNESTNDMLLNKIGVMPIFEQLRRTNKKEIKIGVLTGSLVIIPVSSLEEFKKTATDLNIEKVNSHPLPFDKNYVIIHSNDQLKNQVVHITTEIFQSGFIEVLVGTKSLLGEGWDAPAINSLILASFVGSYVSSNQMRGRAIRSHREDPQKTSNIWHLVCSDLTAIDGGDDVALLKRRFKAFVGISFGDETNIESGIARLLLPQKITSEKTIDRINSKMLLNSGYRSELKEKWKKALNNGTTLVEEMKIPFQEKEEYQKVKSLYYNRTIKYLFAMVGSALVGFIFEVLKGFAKSIKHIKSMEDFMFWMMSIGIVGIVLFGRLTLKSFTAYVKYRDISKDVKNISHALLKSLIKTGSIHTSYSNLKIITNVDKQGAIFCHLEGGTTYEKSTFIKSLQETIEKIKNPRYIIIRKSFFLSFLPQKDYHSVPYILGRKKIFAEYFKTKWSNLVGSCDLIYTRTLNGRKLLLKARINSLAGIFENNTERVNKWR